MKFEFSDQELYFKKLFENELKGHFRHLWIGLNDLPKSIEFLLRQAGLYKNKE